MRCTPRLILFPSCDFNAKDRYPDLSALGSFMGSSGPVIGFRTWPSLVMTSLGSVCGISAMSAVIALSNIVSLLLQWRKVADTNEISYLTLISLEYDLQRLVGGLVDQLIQ